MAREQVQVHGHLAAAPDAVWAVVRDFCGAWHPWIATIRAESSAKGAPIRAFTVTGEDTIYREQLTYFSDSDRVLGYTHLSGIADCEAYDARITISASDSGGSVIGWSATIRAPLARLEGRVAVATLLRRMPDIQLAMPVEQLRWGTNPIMRGLHRLPVKW